MSHYSSPMRSAPGSRVPDRYDGGANSNVYSLDRSGFHDSSSERPRMSNSFRDEYNNDRERSFSGHESSTRSQLQSLRDKYRLSNSTTTAPLTRESLATFSHTRHERGANPSHTTSTTTNPPSSTYSKPATTDRLNVNNYRDSRLNDSFSSAGSAGRLRDIYQDTYLSTDARSYGSAPDHTSAYTPTYDRDYDTSRYSASLKRRESLSPSRGNTYSTKLPSRHEGSPHYGVSSSINNNSSANSNMGPFSTDDGQKYFPNGVSFSDRNGYVPRERIESDSPTSKTKDQLRHKVHQVLRDKDREIHALREKLSTLAMATHTTDPSPIPLSSSDMSNTLPHLSSLPSDKFLADLEHQCGKLRRELNEERQHVLRLNNALAEARIRVDDIDGLREKNTQLGERCQQQEEVINRLTRDNKELATSNEQLRATSNEDIRTIHELKKALDTARKDADELRRKSQHQGEDLDKARVQIDELLRRNNELHAELQDVDGLRSELNDFKAANEEWRAHCDILQSELAKLRQELILRECDTQEKSNDSLQLNGALTRCMKELKSLVGLCSMKARGQDPNMSLILGIGGTSASNMNDDIASVLSGAGGAKKQVEVVHEMTEEIQRLRSMINEAYVDDIDTSTCAQQ